MQSKRLCARKAEKKESNAFLDRNTLEDCVNLFLLDLVESDNCEWVRRPGRVAETSVIHRVDIESMVSRAPTTALLLDCLVRRCDGSMKSAHADASYFFVKSAGRRDATSILKANAAAPKPLSILTTPTPGLQLFSMVNSALTPPNDAP
jgi:hypothetical protein